MFTLLFCLSRDYTDIIHRFTQIIFFTSREAVLDAKNYHDSRQGTNKYCNKAIPKHIHEYQIKRSSTSTKASIDK